MGIHNHWDFHCPYHKCISLQYTLWPYNVGACRKQGTKLTRRQTNGFGLELDSRVTCKSKQEQREDRRHACE